jgi:hypothetical protein
MPSSAGGGLRSEGGFINRLKELGLDVWAVPKGGHAAAVMISVRTAITVLCLLCFMVCLPMDYPRR